MPLNDVDVVRRRHSVGFPSDLVDFIVYSYSEQTFEETHFQSVYDVINLLKKQTGDNKSYWIEVINRSSVGLPNNIKKFCEYFDIHPLTIEDITTLTSNMKLDLFNNQAAIYLLMKIISWDGQRVIQQQISFYLKYSKNFIITFQEKSTNDERVFDAIRNRLRRQRFNNSEQSPYNLHSRLKQMNVDYLFYCLLDAVIERYMLVLEEIAIRIDQFDERLMTDKQSLSLSTFHSIYHLKHDLLHLRILFNPLKEIISRLQHTIQGDRFILFPRTDPSVRLDINHRIVRRQTKPLHHSPHTSNSLLNPLMNTTNNLSEQSRRRRTSIFLDEHTYIYLSDLNDHIDQVIDSLELQRESVSILVSFWLTLNNNETQEILKILMLITALFMPCLLLTGVNSANFIVEPQRESEYGYYIILALLGAIIIGMLTWYKVKRWI